MRPLSVSNTLRLHPSELFSFPVIIPRYRSDISLPRFPTKPSRTSYRRPSDLAPTRKTVPSSCFPNSLRQGGASCSLGSFDLLGILLPSTRPRMSLSRLPPLALKSTIPRGIVSPEPQGCETEGKPHFPIDPFESDRAHTYLVFFTNCRSPSLRTINLPRAIFSPRSTWESRDLR
jgi:hypothetical protein